MQVFQEQQAISEASCQQQLLEAAKLNYGNWALGAYQPGMSDEACLHLLAEPLQRLKQQYGYQSEDVVSLHPDTPKLDAMLAMFEKEHHHTDDEVRVILSGKGIFGIVPEQGEPFELHLEAGDWIVIPAYTRHWFTLGPDRHAVAVRVFKENPAWEAIYEPVLTETAKG